MSKKPNRTCEPVMINNEDLDIIDAICVERYGDDIFSVSRRKELVRRRKEVFHEIIMEVVKSRAQGAVKEKMGELAGGGSSSP